MRTSYRFFVATILLLCITTFAWADEISTVSGTWVGEWTSPDGFVYDASLELQAPADGAVSGQIKWTLKQSPRAQEQSKLGLTASEFVRGTFDRLCGILTLEGYEKTDPNMIIGLDKYRLLLAENHTVLGGITKHYGSWRGLFVLSRSPQ